MKAKVYHVQTPYLQELILLADVKTLSSNYKWKLKWD